MMKGQGATDWAAVTMHASEAGYYAGVPAIAVLADLTQAYDRVPRLNASIMKDGLDLPVAMVKAIPDIYTRSGFVDRPTAEMVPMDVIVPFVPLCRPGLFVPGSLVLVVVVALVALYRMEVGGLVVDMATV